MSYYGISHRGVDIMNNGTVHPESDYAKRDAMKTIRIKLNIYGNYMCYVGKVRDRDYGNEWDAKAWAADLVKYKGYIVSEKSDVSANDVAVFIHNYL